MPLSFRYPNWALRAGLALVYLWFGIDKFIQPQYWIDAWMPMWAQHAVTALGMGPANGIALLGLFEVLVAVSLATGFFIRYFASIAVAFLLVITVTHGINEINVRNIGLIGGLAALALWPERRYI
jgi:uncharacterized membrane protein YphA (DoxX/SURF4 family)